MGTPEPFSMYEPAVEEGPLKLLLIGEAPGEEEEKARRPFVGQSGKLLDELLQMAGLSRKQFHLTNTFSARPPQNDLKAWTLTKTELKKAGYSEAGRLPQINRRFLHPDRESELQRLRTEVLALEPDFVLAVGGTALWALTGDSRITLHRGTVFKSADYNCSALATFHPAMVLRQWDQRPIVWADLLKVKRHLQGTLPAPKDRLLWINPTQEELELVYSKFLAGGELLGVDIETAPGCDQITTIAFGTAEECICIPVWNKATLPELCNCYGTASEEAAAWAWIKRFAALPNPKVFQNGLYDLQYLIDVLDIRPANIYHDTAILQHCLQPELPKALGTLSSLYLNEPSWKFMREGSKEDNKADE